HLPHLHPFPTRRSSDLVATSNIQHPRSREDPNSKFQQPRMGLGVWILDLLWILDVGCWMFACLLIATPTTAAETDLQPQQANAIDRKSTRLNSSHGSIS